MKQIYELLCPPYSHSLIVMEHLHVVIQEWHTDAYVSKILL